MPRKRYSTEQIVTKLHQAEVELGRGLRTSQVCKKLGVSEQTYYRWRKEYGGAYASTRRNGSQNAAGVLVVPETVTDGECHHGCLYTCCVYPFPSAVPLNLSRASLSLRNVRMSSAASRSLVHCSL